MRPDDINNRRVTPQIPRRDFTQPHVPTRDVSQDAAANVVRGHIEQIYSQQTPQNVDSNPQIISEQEITSPYQRTHAQTPAPQANQWHQYHSAWQNYYQQYYERYYVTHMHKAKQDLETRTPSLTKNDTGHTSGIYPENRQEDSDRKEAVHELQNQLIDKVKTSASEVRKSRHFVPIAAALTVVLLFGFLQYNRVLISNVKAYVTPGNIDPQNIIVDPTSMVSVSPEPRLIIPKINIDVPVNYGVGADHNSQMKAMETGVAHFAIPGANSVPGQVGNTAISGHSSNDLFDNGDYKFIFAQLERLEKGDTIYANYKGTRYTYVVTKKEEVLPSQIDKLIYETDKPVITLITCTPLGTALRRLLVTAEQVSPSLRDAKPAPAAASDVSSTNMPGNSQTLLERIFN